MLVKNKWPVVEIDCTDKKMLEFNVIIGMSSGHNFNVLLMNFQLTVRQGVQPLFSI